MNISQKRIDKGLWWERAWSLVDGCTKVSEGCDNCWSLSLANRVNPDVVHTEGRGDINWSENIILREDRLDLPLRVKKPTVWAIWNDLFHEKVPFEFIDKVIITTTYFVTLWTFPLSHCGTPLNMIIEITLCCY